MTTVLIPGFPIESFGNDNLLIPGFPLRIIAGMTKKAEAIQSSMQEFPDFRHKFVEVQGFVKKMVSLGLEFADQAAVCVGTHHDDRQGGPVFSQP